MQHGRSIAVGSGAMATARRECVRGNKTQAHMHPTWHRSISATPLSTPIPSAASNSDNGSDNDSACSAYYLFFLDGA